MFLVWGRSRRSIIRDFSRVAKGGSWVQTPGKGKGECITTSIHTRKFCCCGCDCGNCACTPCGRSIFSTWKLGLSRRYVVASRVTSRVGQTQSCVEFDSANMFRWSQWPRDVKVCLSLCRISRYSHNNLIEFLGFCSTDVFLPRTKNVEKAG